MRSNPTLLCIFSLATGLVVATVPARAGDPYGERYHADTFGNLVVYSPAGYKRIIVGQGHVLAEYQAQAGTADPDTYYDGTAESRSYQNCRTVPGMFKGRSHMYGLPDGVVPTPARRVCD